MTAQLPPGDDLAAIRAQLAGISDQLASLEKRQPGVVITGERIGFAAWIGILVKISLASIPALIIVAITLFFLFAILSAFGMAFFG